MLVLLVAFGPAVPGSLAALFGGLAGPAVPPITNTALLHSVLYELVLLALLAALLRARGWRWARLGLSPSWQETGMGVLLAVGWYLAYLVLWNLTRLAWPGFAEVAHTTRLVAGGLKWPAIVLVTLVNPVFEEVLLCGYLVTTLKEHAGVSTAINVSAGVRVFCHFYQGAPGRRGIAPMALLFAWWYARSARLWPLIVAHALIDLAGLALGK